MKDYKVTVMGTETVVELPEHDFRMRVLKSDAYVLKGETAILEATLYIEKSSFIPSISYLFELINNDGNPINECADLSLFKASVDFYFQSIHRTDLYVKSIPNHSILCPKGLKKLFYDRE